MVKKALVCGVLCLLLSACGGTASRSTSSAPPAPGVKVGQPYTVGGTTYYPAYDPHYDQTGIASWYGPGFHGGKTANGEKYDQTDFTAAHPTLPLPCMVRVTNVQNGSSIIVRINDRGPFKKGRIIDLSYNAARALGIGGTARVRVQFLPKETEQYWAKRHLKSNDIQFAANDPNAPGKAVASAGSNVGDADEAVPQETAASENIAPESSNQVAAAAPVMSVNTADINADKLKFRPRQSQFRVVGEANAAEVRQPGGISSSSLPPLDNAADTSAEPFSPPRHPQPRAVQLNRGGNTIQSRDMDESESAPSGSPFHTGPSVPAPANVAEEEAPAPAAAHSTNAGEAGWYIQAGSFASTENAQSLASRLKAVGATETADVQSQGKTWHRVRVGPFASRQAAQTALEQAKQQGASGAWLVKE